MSKIIRHVKTPALFKVEINGEEKYVDVSYDCVDPRREECMFSDISSSKALEIGDILDTYIYVKAAYHAHVEWIEPNVGEIFTSYRTVYVKISCEYMKRYIELTNKAYISCENMNLKELRDMQMFKENLEKIFKKAVEKAMNGKNARMMYFFSHITYREVTDDTDIAKLYPFAVLEHEETNRLPACNLFASDYQPLLYGDVSNAIMKMNTKNLDCCKFSDNATWTDGSGIIIDIENFNKGFGAISTSAKKLLDALILALAQGNYYRTDSVNPRISINLVDYWIANGLKVEPISKFSLKEQVEESNRIENYIHTLKSSIRSDLNDLMKVRWSWDENKKNKGSMGQIALISAYCIKRNILSVNFDISMATYLVKAYIMQYPLVLLKLDNRNHNGYAIGRRIARHHSMDNNAAIGTLNTLSVKSLLDCIPEIQSYESLIEKKRRDWRTKIKGKLEAAIKSNVDIGYLKRWEYRDSKSGQIYDTETSNFLSWDDYSRLMVDFVIKKEPDQEERRARRAEEAEKKAIEAGISRKKRGRPRKKENT